MSEVVFTLFVSGRTTRSRQVIANLRRLCSEDLAGRCRVTIVDVLEQRARTEEYKIMATPTLIKSAPLPARRIIGDLSDTRRLLSHLALRSDKAPNAVDGSGEN